MEKIKVGEYVFNEMKKFREDNGTFILSVFKSKNGTCVEAKSIKSNNVRTILVQR